MESEDAGAADAAPESTAPDARSEPPLAQQIKVLLVLDQSYSMQCTDPAEQRVVAMNRFTASVLASPFVEVGSVAFAGRTHVLQFTSDLGALRDFVISTTALARALGPASDLQGALAIATDLLETDMNATPAEERARTRYIVVTLTDGTLGPVCHAGCEDDTLACSDEIDNDGDGLVDESDTDCEDLPTVGPTASIECDDAFGPCGTADCPGSTPPELCLPPDPPPPRGADTLYGVCNAAYEVVRWVREESGSYADFLSECPAYNQPDQLREKVTALARLGVTHHAASVNVHFRLLSATPDQVAAACGGDAAAALGYDVDEATMLLRNLATAGAGSFRAADPGDDTLLDTDLLSSP